MHILKSSMLVAISEQNIGSSGSTWDPDGDGSPGGVLLTQDIVATP